MNRIVFLVWLLLCAPVAGAEVAFPVRVAEGGRHLVDREGRPFLYQADTAWMLFLKLTEEEAVEYLRVRKGQGFNVVQVMLTGFLGMRNREGQLPFDGGHDFARPNEKYFSHVDRVVRRAEEMGVMLAVAPLWVGCCGEGWAGVDKEGRPKPMKANGVEKSRAFGKWIGERYGKFKNVIWIMGGDNDPGPDREEIRAVAMGIKDAAPGQLITYHAASSHSSTDVYPDEKWLDVVMVYTYFRGFNKAWNKNQPDVYEVSYKEYGKRPVRPFFLGESTYEGEHDAWGSALLARKQAYWCVLSGGMGHAYGSPNWNFPKNWREVMRKPGAESLKHLRGVLESREWTKLVPDEKREFVTAGHGEFAKNDYVTAAVARGASFGVVYLPGVRTITVDLSKVKGEVEAQWFDPTSGAYCAAAAGEGNRFTPPGKNAGGDGDWVLVVEGK